MCRSISILAISLGLLCLSTSAETSGQEVRAEGEQGVLVGISLEPAHVTLHEPVLLNLSIVNGGHAVAHIDLGRDRKEGLLIDITSPAGSKVSLSWPRHSGFSRKGDFDVGAGERYAQSFILNEVYNFDASGFYEVEVSLAKLLLRTSSVGQQNFHATIQIEPRNESLLEKRCEAILTQIQDAPSYERAAEGALALSYVKDPVAVPYLQKLLVTNNLVGPIAIRGLESIATPEAVRALSSALQLTKNNTSVLAKAALLRMESECSDPLVKQEIRRVIEEVERPHS